MDTSGLDREYRILLTGGGSGGHVYPLLTIAVALKERLRGKVNLYYLGPASGYDDLFTKEGIVVGRIGSAKLRRYVSLANVLDAVKLPFIMIHAFMKVFSIMPDAVFSKGGTSAWPIVVASWLLRIPVIIHESDAIPGMNNRLSAPFAEKIALSFRECASFFSGNKTFWTGPIIRKEVLQAMETNSADAKQRLGFKGAKPLLLVLGGSQGSLAINQLIDASLDELLPLVDIYHQRGADPGTDPREGYRSEAYIADMGPALQAADVVISRSGSQIFEIAAFGKPMILIPHQAGNDHQRANAYAFRQKEAAIVIEENELFPAVLKKQVIALTGQEGTRIGDNARAFYQSGATERLTAAILEFVKK